MKITIKPCRNGATVSYDDGENENSEAYKFDSEELDDLRHLLYDIVEVLGYYGSKYDRERLYIKIEHGRDYECEGCEICKEEK